MHDIVELRIINEDDRFTYGEKWRNGQKVTDWVRIKDAYLKATGRAHTERVLAASTNEHYAG